MTGPLSLLKSRKFALMVIAILVVLLNKKLGLDLSVAEVGAVILPIVAAILGIAWEDTAKTNAGWVDLGPPEAVPEDAEPE